MCNRPVQREQDPHLDHAAHHLFVIGQRELRKVPETEVAAVWDGEVRVDAGHPVPDHHAVVPDHPVLWIFFGHVGAWRSGSGNTGQRSAPGWRDFFIVVGGCLFYIFLFLPVFLRLKGVV
jgi:hypothetical protein